MNVNWEALGAAGELLGSILVLATLIYLAIQTRSLNKQSKAETRYAFVDAMGEINMAIAQNEQSASVWRRGLDGAEQLDEDERMQFLMFLGQYCNLWSIMHQLHDDNLLPQRQWLIVRNDLVSILGSPGGRYFWENGGESAFDERFVKFVQSELGSDRKAYDMSSMAQGGAVK